MKRWLKFWIIVILGFCLNLGWSLTIKAQVLPSQLVQQAQKHYQIGNYHQSIALLDQANAVYQSRGEYLQQAQVLSLRSLAQQQLGQWQEARASLGNSLGVIKAVAPSKDKIQVLAQIWNGKGHFQFLRGNNRQALEYWQEAEQLYRQIGDRLGIEGTLLDQAQTLTKMGFYSRSCNRVLAAFEYTDYDCANLTPPQLKSIVQQAAIKSSDWQINGLSSLGNSLLSMGKLSQAQILIEANQSIYGNASAATQAKIWLDLGNINKAIALRDLARDDLPSFSYHSREATKYYHQLDRHSSQHQVIHAYKLPAQLNHLSLLIACKQWSKAQKLANRIDLSAEGALKNSW